MGGVWRDACSLVVFHEITGHDWTLFWAKQGVGLANLASPIFLFLLFPSFSKGTPPSIRSCCGTSRTYRNQGGGRGMPSAESSAASSALCVLPPWIHLAELERGDGRRGGDALQEDMFLFLVGKKRCV